MSQRELYQWSEEIRKHLPLKKWQALGLALFSIGIVLAERCTLSKVAEKLVWRGKADSVERQFQRLLANPRLKVEALFGRWTGWIVSKLASDELTLLVDETKLGKHLGVMMVGLAYRSCCIPLAWRCYHFDAYPVEGQVGLIQTLLRQVKAGLSPQHQVKVEVDRGIGTSPLLVKAIQALGFDFLFRVQGTTRFKSEQGKEYPLKHLVKMGEHWTGSGYVFKKHGWLRVQVYVYWELGYTDLWCLISNRDDLHGRDYAIRYWQEAGFRDLKSDGWNWQRSQVWQPDHAQRLILIMALAYAWMLSLGTLIAQAPPALRLLITRGSRRTFSLFRQGLRFFAHLCASASPIPLKLSFVPEGIPKTVVS